MTTFCKIRKLNRKFAKSDSDFREFQTKTLQNMSLAVQKLESQVDKCANLVEFEKRCKMIFFAKFGFDTAEIEPRQVSYFLI